MLDRDDLRRELEADRPTTASSSPSTSRWSTWRRVSIVGCRGALPVARDPTWPGDGPRSSSPSPRRPASSTGSAVSCSTNAWPPSTAGARRTSIEVSVNVSPLQLRHETFTAYLARSCSRARSTPTALTIEITESLPAAGDGRDRASSATALRRHRASAYRWMTSAPATRRPSQLERLPLTELKLDRSLIQSSRSAMRRRTLRGREPRRAEHGPADRGRGHRDAGASAIWRANFGCDRAQGYLLGAPMLVADVDALLRR